MFAKRRWAALFFIVVPVLGVVELVACGSSTFQSDADSGVDASTSDQIAPFDQVAPDQMAPDQAAPDGAGGDAGPTSFCLSLSKIPYACADFDESTQNGGYVNGASGSLFPTFVDSSDAGAIVRIPAGEMSSQALRALIPALDAGDTEAAYATTGSTLAGQSGAMHFRLDVDLRIDHAVLSTAALVDFLAFRLDGTLGNFVECDLAFSDHVELDIGELDGTGQRITLGPVPDTGAWFHASIDVALGGPKNVTATFNGSSVSTSASTFITETHPTVTLGMQTDGGNGEIEVSYDDLTLYVSDSLDGG